MKKIALLVLLASSNIALAELVHEEYDAKPMVEGHTRVQELMDWNRDHPGEMPPLTDQEKYEFFTKKGMPIPGTGAKVVSDPKSLQMTKAQSIAVAQFNADQKNKGYHEMVNMKAKNLLNMPETAEREYNARKSIPFNPQDTHLYEIKSTMAMAYPYKGIPAHLATKIIGYAPESTFVNNGWTGAVVFFTPAFNSVCAYRQRNIQITKTAAFIPKEVATYNVNSKLTTMNTTGSKESGFVYEVEWWDKSFKHNLECASKEYQSEFAAKTLELAKQIDDA